MAAPSVNCGWLLLLIYIAYGSSENEDFWSPLNADILLPYGPGGAHGPSHSHRYVRDCQSVTHGNVTYETWPSNRDAHAPVAETKLFVSPIRIGHCVQGHVTVVSNPLQTFSVLEPGGAGGCGKPLTETVTRTAGTRRCLYAQNGGFFNTSNNRCLGNVVSDGTLVQNSGGIQNSQFGIKKDGTLVFGYLSQEDVQGDANPFVQLVSGVVWLLRNGKVYINESMEAECSKTQETGSFNRFVNVVSARTALGHDKEGRLVLFHIDGETDNRGMNLWEVAEFLQRQGVVNAVNLDGGGSSTFVAGGSLASYPSDSCHPYLDGTRWRCPRAVSTVLCVHEPPCQPEDCGGRGSCIGGRCVCHSGWAGPACRSPSCQQSACGDHGLCTQYGCACDAGWMGTNCSQVCPPGFYGDGCNQTCTCTNGGVCDPVHGRCSCPAGFQGEACEQECPLGFYGLGCKRECHCPNKCLCDPVKGSCNVTWHGERNQTIHTASHCLARELLKTWQEEVEAHRVTPYFTERTWLTITVVLGMLLLASAVGNVIQVSRKPGTAGFRATYSYVPLAEMTAEMDYEDRPDESKRAAMDSSISY
uniref:N-acetylglucosamine-1-phosphodiester alpha-N-acetylglucosaminidase n=2 Tax=Paramormyrops kingsleyae TaxID=1676925 RepID=A0A3B3R7Y4_9TELE|nr:N-acetylglucosamine-1-phosphodiester alpha-N-acetylglucosaminidase isoform X1 [Paramormyrops kingsleyae]